ncbi:MAG: hypothetical protein ABL889_20560 [Terricaulis sp.]
MGEGKVYYLDVSGARSRHGRWGDLVLSIIFSVILSVAAVVLIGALGFVDWGSAPIELAGPFIYLGMFALMPILYGWKRADIWRRMKGAFVEPYGLSLFKTWRAIRRSRRSGAQAWGIANAIAALGAFLGIVWVADHFGRQCSWHGECEYWQFPQFWAVCATFALLALNTVRLFGRGGALAGYLTALAGYAAFVGMFFGVPNLLTPVFGVPQDVVPYVVVFIVWPLALWWFSRTEAWLRSKLRPTPDHVRSHDRRSPIIYLRAFDDDAIHFKVAGVDGNPDQKPLDDVIAAELHALGPFIAIGKPGELRPKGAARAYFENHAWQPAVQEMMDRAQMIVAVAGWTPGLQWELSNLVHRGHLQKVAFVIPSNHREARLDWLRHALQGTVFGDLLRKADLRRARVVHLAGSNLLVTIGDGGPSDFELGMITAAYATRVLRPKAQSDLEGADTCLEAQAPAGATAKLAEQWRLARSGNVQSITYVGWCFDNAKEGLAEDAARAVRL